jgi:phage terminase large subunit
MAKKNEAQAVRVNRQFYDCIKSKNRYLIHVGGSRSGKSHGIQQFIIYICQISREERIKILNINPAEYPVGMPFRIRIFRTSLPELRKSIYSEFIDMLMSLGLYNKEHHRQAEFVYNLNGVKISFIGTNDNPQALRGAESEISFLNEANAFSKEEYKQINMRTKFKVIFDYNPSMNDHWLYDLEDNEDIPTDAYYSTYKDNKFLPKEQVQVIEDFKYTDPETYKVYALGQRGGRRKGRIFTTWEKIDKLPEGLVFWGLDFGYTKDPTALVKCVKIDNCLYAEECMYDTGVMAGDIEAALMRNGYQYGDMVFCDHNQPIIVDELRRMQVNAVKAKKGNNSVLEGIESLKRLRIFATEESKNLWEEYTKYSYKLKRGGDPDNDNDWLNEPEDKWNHCIDSLRYAYVSKFRIGKEDFFVV